MQKDLPVPVILPVRNIMIFALLVLIGNAPLWIFSKSLMPYREWMAAVVAKLVSLSGLEVVQKGVYLSVADERWIITPECTAITAMIVFTAFVLAYPSSIKSKGIAILAGLPFLLAANITRLFTLAWATKLAVKYAHWIHDYVWQVGFLMLIAVMWLIWIELVVKREKSMEPHRT